MNLLLVLHALRIKGVANIESICLFSGLTAAKAEGCIKELEAQGLVRVRAGAVSGWSLTPMGRDRDKELIAHELEAIGERPSVEECYEAFCSLNSAFLATCTAWQIRGDGADRLINDHCDSEYDQAVLSSLDQIGAELLVLLDDLTSVLSRFAPYRERLRHGLNRVASGEFDWFTGPLIDSVHTVWFELHEDLLSTLDIPRSSGYDNGDTSHSSRKGR